MIPQLQRETTVSAPESTTPWSLATKVGFRFAFAYFLLWVYPRAIGSLGKGIVYHNPLKDMWHAVVPWVGANILHLTGDFTEVANGSGDQLYDYIQIFCVAVLAAVIALVWSLLDRKRQEYQTLHQWMRIFVRVVLTVAMLSYGANKLWWAQFPAPRLVRLVEPYGQTQPADLMWTFMGMSRAYSLFGGLGELLGAVLLIIPEMTTLGALVTAAVMTNVLMLNLGYDVPRKIYSIHLIALCIFLMIPDIRRMLDFFVLNRPAQLTKPVPLFRDKFLNRGIMLLYILIAAGAFYDQGVYSYKSALDTQTKLPPSIRGIWTVNQLKVDGLYRPPMVTDSERWRRVVFDNPYEMAIQPMDGPVHRYILIPDLNKKTMLIWKPFSTRPKDKLTYDDSRPDVLSIQGEVDGHDVSATMSRVDLSDPINFALTNRGFHWVNQYMHWINQFENWH